jgi:hypothetical protein
MTIDEVWKRLQKEGPSHLLLDKEGTVQMTQVALKKNPDVRWDLIYIRNDGYTLGCDFYLTQYAEHLHRADWIAVVSRGARTPKLVNFGS